MKQNPHLFSQEPKDKNKNKQTEKDFKKQTHCANKETNNDVDAQKKITSMCPLPVAHMP